MKPNKFATSLVTSIAILQASECWAATYAAPSLPKDALIELASGGSRYTNGIPIPVQKTLTFAGSPAASSANRLELRVHGLSDGQLSIKVNNLAPITIANSTDNDAADGDWDIVLKEKAYEYGGIGGGYHTILLTLNLPKNAITSSETNRIHFIFQPLAGVEVSAQRVLSVRLLSSENVATVPAYTVTNPPQEDGEIWIDEDTPDNIKAGKDYWDTEALFDHPVSRQAINAKCGDCHTKSGGDLAYFGFSDYSIFKRALWHGMNANKARKLTRYIRSLAKDTSVNNPWQPSDPSWGRPWNPPYQPGPDVKERVETGGKVDPDKARNWSAGAGLSAVLKSDSQMLEQLFPNKTYTTQRRVDWVFNTGRKAVKRANNVDDSSIEEDEYVPLAVPYLAVPLQLPDWNRWLPRIHPMDVWKDGAFPNEGNVDNSKRNFTNVPKSYQSDANPYARYVAAQEAIETGFSGITNKRNIGTAMSREKRFAIMNEVSLMDTQSRKFISFGCDESIEHHWADFSTNGVWRALFPQWFPGGIHGVDAGFNGTLGGSSGSTAPIVDWLSPGQPDLAREIAKDSLASWIAVKHFELMHANFLEHQAGALLDEVLDSPDDDEMHADPLGWPLRGQSVFAKAPHMTANNKILWGYQPFKLSTNGSPILFGSIDMKNTDGPWAVDSGYYNSVIWYHVQLVLNSGHRLANGSVAPVDWPYSLEHIELLAGSTNIGLPLLQTTTLLKAYQAKDNLLLDQGWFLRMCEPRHLFSNGDNDASADDNMAALDGYSSTEGTKIRARLIHAALKQWLQVVNHDDFQGRMTTKTDPLTTSGVNNDVSAWRRKNGTPEPGDGNESYWQLEPRGVAQLAYPAWEAIDKTPRMNSDRSESYARFIPTLARYCAETSGLNDHEKRNFAKSIDDFAKWCDIAWPGVDADSSLSGYQRSNHWTNYPSSAGWDSFKNLLTP